MDEADVKVRAKSHGDAVVAGDMRTAGGDLLPEAVAQAPEVMSGMPKPVRSAEIVEVRNEDDAVYTVCAYRGDNEELKVQSRWIERDGTPKIADLQVV